MQPMCARSCACFLSPTLNRRAGRESAQSHVCRKRRYARPERDQSFDAGGPNEKSKVPIPPLQTAQHLTSAHKISEITRRLVQYFRPERIYLFGSAGRGDYGPNSDLDFCVVLPDDASPELYRPGVHKPLWGPRRSGRCHPVRCARF